MTNRSEVKLVREGAYVAEVEITLIEGQHEWAPYVSPADVQKVDDVRAALLRGDIDAASRLAKVYELRLIAAE